MSEVAELIHILNDLHLRINEFRTKVPAFKPHDNICKKVQNDLSAIIDALLLVSENDPDTLVLVNELMGCIEQVNEYLFMDIAVEEKQSAEQVQENAGRLFSLVKILRLFQHSFRMRLLYDLQMRAKREGKTTFSADHVAVSELNRITVYPDDGESENEIELDMKEDSQFSKVATMSKEASQKFRKFSTVLIRRKSTAGGMPDYHISPKQKDRTVKAQNPTTLFGLHGSMLRISSPSRKYLYSVRKKQLRMIVDKIRMLSPKKVETYVPICVVISGEPGSGKTEYAKHIVKHLNSLNRLDYRCYVDLKDASLLKEFYHNDTVQNESESVVENVMKIFSTPPTLGLTDQFGFSGEGIGIQEARAAGIKGQYRDLFWNKRGVIVFDNATDAEQIRELTPQGSDCIVVVLTQDPALAKSISVVNVVHQKIQRFNAPDAINLISKQAQISQPTINMKPIASLSKTAGYYPLPMQLCVSLLLEAPDQLTRLGKDIASVKLTKTEKNGQRDLNRVLAFIYNTLDPVTQKSFELLHVAPGSMTEYAYNLIIGPVDPSHDQDDAGVPDSLRLLLTRGLMTTTSEDRTSNEVDENESGAPSTKYSSIAEEGQEDEILQRYEMHPAIAAYAASLAKAHKHLAPLVEEAKERFVSFYCDLVQEIEQLLVAYGDVRDALLSFDLEAHNIYAAMEIVLHDPNRYRVGQSLLLPHEIYTHRLSVGQRLSLFKCAKNLITKEDPAYIDLMCALGDVYIVKGETGKAGAHYKLAEQKVSPRNSDKHADVLVLIGHSCRAKHDTMGAAETYQVAEQIYTATGNQTGLAHVLSLQGLVFKLMGSFDKSLHYHEKSLAVYMDTENVRGIATALLNIACIYEVIGEYHQALDAYDKSTLLWKELILKEGIAECLYGAAMCYERLGELRKGRKLCEKCTNMYVSMNSPSGYVRAMHLMGVLFQRRSDFRKALAYYEQCRPTLLFLNDKRKQAEVLNSAASVTIKLGLVDLAATFAEQSVALNTQIDNTIGLAFSYNLKGTTLESKGLFNDAGSSFDRSLMVRTHLKSVNRGISLGCLHNNLAIIYEELGDYIRSIQHYERSVAFREKDKKVPALSHVLFNLACRYQDVGHFAKSLQLLERCKVLENGQAFLDRSPAYHSIPRIITVIQKLLANPRKSLEVLRKNIEEFEEREDTVAVAVLCANIGNQYYSLSDKDGSKHYFEQAKRIFEDVKAEMVQNVSDSFSETDRNYAVSCCDGELKPVNEKLANIYGQHGISAPSASDGEVVGS